MKGFNRSGVAMTAELFDEQTPNARRDALATTQERMRHMLWVYGTHGHDKITGDTRGDGRVRL